MGYEIERFTTEVDPEFICSICTDVLQGPVMLPDCEHFFCRTCLHQWWKSSNRCPMCNTVFSNTLSPPRLLRTFMGRLYIGCTHTECIAIVPFDQLGHHESHCEFRPVNKFWKGVKSVVNGFFSIFTVAREPPQGPVPTAPLDHHDDGFNFD